MTVPNPQSINGNAKPFRLRQRKGISIGTGKKISCFKIIIFLLGLQVTIFVIVMKMTHRHTKERNADWRERVLRHRIYAQRAKSPDEEDDDEKVNQELKQKLAQFEVGDELQNRVIYSPEHKSEAIDNYGSRTHMPKREDWERSAPYLIVGGSDGSGTRAVVDTLMDLGAFMHFEDRRTMDVHGSQMFKQAGWPPLVNLILNETRSANYELNDLSEVVRARAITELAKLKKSIDKRAETKARRKTTTERHATAIYVGWKAPVSMVLLPVLRAVFGPVKFLHVVRDGRDVALSDNQSPVKKFYNTYYGLPLKPEPNENKTTIYAMQLWNDWNHQVMEWGTTHSDGSSFDYLTIRSEDLVNPETKFDALLEVADFIGSKKSVAEICCMSVKQVKDMGKSTASFGDLSKNRKRARHGPANFMGLGIDKEEWMGKLLFGKKFHPGLHRQDLTKDDDANGLPLRKEKSVPHTTLEERENTARLMHDEFIRKRQEGRDHKRNTRHAPHDPYARGGDLSAMERRKQEIELEKEAGAETLHRQLIGFNPRERKFRPHHPLGEGVRQNKLEKEEPEKVMARYGKWVKALEDKPELSEKLHTIGNTSLQAFGYNPPTVFLDRPDEKFSKQCQEVLDANVCPT